MNASLRPAALLFAISLIAACSGTEPMMEPVQTQAASDQWLTLFDGSSLDGWTQAGPGERQPSMARLRAFR